MLMYYHFGGEAASNCKNPIFLIEKVSWELMYLMRSEVLGVDP